MVSLEWRRPHLRYSRNHSLTDFLMLAWFWKGEFSVSLYQYHSWRDIDWAYQKKSIANLCQDGHRNACTMKQLSLRFVSTMSRWSCTVSSKSSAVVSARRLKLRSDGVFFVSWLMVNAARTTFALNFDVTTRLSQQFVIFLCKGGEVCTASISK